MSWAGCRISCLGDYADEPPGMVSEAEYEERDTYKALAKNPQRVLYYFLKKTSRAYEYPFRSVELRVVRMLVDRPKPASPVFRNLTKREYIREDVGMGGHHTKCSFFGRVLLARICWSTDPSSAMKYDMCNGKWAGDRIDCVELQNLESVLGGQLDNHDGNQEEQRPWKDITSEAYSLLHDIYDANSGASDMCCGYTPEESETI